MSKIDLVNAFKTKLILADKEAEGDWRSNLNKLHKQVRPQNRRTVAASIKDFSPLTIGLIRAKAAAMVTAVSDVHEESQTGLGEDEWDTLRQFVLSYFSDSSYLKRMDGFLESLKRDFGRMGLVFHPSEWRTDLSESLFSVGVKNTLRNTRASIEADLTIIAARRTTEGETCTSVLSTLNDLIEFKPNFCGVGFNGNALICKILSRFKRGKQIR